MWTKEQKNEWQKKRRAENKNAYTHKYEKTPMGFLVRKYRNMKSRVTGVQKKKYHLYKGLYLLPKQFFYSWSLVNLDFQELWKKWVESGYERRLCPSVDRIDSNKGYTLDNMRWITHSENSKGGCRSAKRHFKNKHTGVSFTRGLWRIYCTRNGKQIHGGYFKTEEEAVKAYGKWIKTV